MAYVRELSEKDIKVGCLKQLQGQWLHFLLKYHVSANIGSAYSMRSFLFIYHKLFFQHTDAEIGDITAYISDYFDTATAGSKVDAASYKTIAEKTGIKASSWLFLSDNVKEIEAAKLAGMDAAIVVRPGNTPLTPEARDAHLVVQNGFEEVTTRISCK
ncbi:enolase-phosphatase E1 [Maublancomyces gigas]|uniref:Enolase-phosphatase E1 n=1 Tax=Discina gigas TaxID=1032678 RepID=A0ABR3GXI1_9PEZI